MLAHDYVATWEVLSRLQLPRVNPLGYFNFTTPFPERGVVALSHVG